ncbi:MAG: YdiU family protein [Idiomarina sp.]|nr:YdiU family protein [Idiomarina sp.]
MLSLPAFMQRSAPPTPVAAPQWIAWNDELAASLKLPNELQDRKQALAILAGNHQPAWSEPTAVAYAGHQFGHFVPQLGDGRAVLLAEILHEDGGLRDIQLKGSGTTPFSRGGDGRSPMGPVLREYLMSEAMHKLGIPTTRALAAVATGEAVYREDAEPGAILTRVAQSHIRVGSFQYAAHHEGKEGVKALADWVIARHYPDLATQPAPYFALFEAICQKQAELVSGWMSIGFIHGVMNTDNTSVCGETIDYGPCAFMDQYHAERVFSFIDKRGRYAYANQPVIAQWNLARLAECLIPLWITEDALGDQSEVVAKAKHRLQEFIANYERLWLERMTAKIGISSPEPHDRELINDLLALFQAEEIDFTQGFRFLLRGTRNHCQDIERFDQWLMRWQERVVDQEAAATLMNQVNPAIVPRTHLIQAVIESAQTTGNLEPFHNICQALLTPFSATHEGSKYDAPPEPEERVRNTFCGT